MIGRGIGLVVLGTLVLATGAAGDSIELSARAPVGAAPSHAELSYEVSAGPGTRTTATVTEGALTACAADSADGVSARRSFPFGGSSPESGGTYIDSTTVPLSVGTWTLCGWVESGLDPPSHDAVGGPVHFTVGGPAGETKLKAPATTESEQVQVDVSYRLTEQSGEIPGASGAEIGAWAQSESALVDDPDQVCSGIGSTSYTTSLSAIGGGTALNAPSSGEVTFTGHLPPGEYELCSYLIEPLTGTGAVLPNLNSSPMFGISSSKLRVLANPLVSGLRMQPRRSRLARSGSLELSYSLNVPATATVKVQRLRGGRRCASSSRGCGLPVTVGTVRVPSEAGPETIHLARHLRARALSRGTYRVTVTARSHDGALSPAVRTSFAILG